MAEKQSGNPQADCPDQGYTLGYDKRTNPDGTTEQRLHVPSGPNMPPDDPSRPCDSAVFKGNKSKDGNTQSWRFHLPFGKWWQGIKEAFTPEPEKPRPSAQELARQLLERQGLTGPHRHDVSPGESVTPFPNGTQYPTCPPGQPPGRNGACRQ